MLVCFGLGISNKHSIAIQCEMYCDRFRGILVRCLIMCCSSLNPWSKQVHEKCHERWEAATSWKGNPVDESNCCIRSVILCQALSSYVRKCSVKLWGLFLCRLLWRSRTDSFSRQNLYRMSNFDRSNAWFVEIWRWICRIGVLREQHCDPERWHAREVLNSSAHRATQINIAQQISVKILIFAVECG